MELSLKPKENLRANVVTFATAIALALVIGSAWVGSARADNDDHRGGNRGGDQHHDNDNRGRGPSVRYSPQPDYYYAPQPNYYYAPEPYGYYGAPEPEYSEPAPDGISLFFGL